MGKSEFLTALVPQYGEPQELFTTTEDEQRMPRKRKRLSPETAKQLAIEERQERLLAMASIVELAEQEGKPLSDYLPPSKFSDSVIFDVEKSDKFERLTLSLQERNDLWE